MVKVLEKREYDQVTGAGMLRQSAGLTTWTSGIRDITLKESTLI